MQLRDLKNFSELSQKMFDEVPASIIVVDRGGKILAVNKTFSLYTSKPGSAMIGKSLFARRELRHPGLKEKYRALLKSGRPFFRHIIKHNATLQDRVYTMSLSAVPLRDNNHRLIGAISIAQDISSLVEVQDKLEIANNRLQKRIEDYAAELVVKQKELEKSLDSRNQFFSDASHELRTPLTIIKGNVDLIRMRSEKYPVPSYLQDELNNISLEVERMSDLLGDIMVLNRSDSQQESQSLALVSLDSLVRREAGNFKAAAKLKQTGIRLSLAKVAAVADEKSILKLVNNLVSNALRYTEKGGRINVRLFKKGRTAVLQVADNGIGISSKDLPHIFDRFYRAGEARQRVSGGTGLGLAICRHVVQQHKGTIEVKSRPGKGTTFTVILPL